MLWNKPQIQCNRDITRHRIPRMFHQLKSRSEVSIFVFVHLCNLFPHKSTISPYKAKHQCTVKLTTLMWHKELRGIIWGYFNARNISDPLCIRGEVDMENIDRLVAREECKKLFRQPTLVAGDLSLNSNHSEPEKRLNS